MSIDQWPTTERPREKLVRQGAQQLSNAELLAILLRTGSAGKSAVDLGLDILKQFGSLSALFSAPRQQLLKINGLGNAKVASLLAVQELGRRSMLEALNDHPVLKSPSATRQYLCAELAGKQREVFWVLFLNSQHRVIASEAMFYGTLDSANVHPREIVKACLDHNAAAVILAHNHPSGSLAVSDADKAITKTLIAALGVIDVRVLDHFIIGHNHSVSMAEQGLL